MLVFVQGTKDAEKGGKEVVLQLVGELDSFVNKRSLHQSMQAALAFRLSEQIPHVNLGWLTFVVLGVPEGCELEGYRKPFGTKCTQGTRCPMPKKRNL